MKNAGDGAGHRDTVRRFPVDRLLDSDVSERREGSRVLGAICVSLRLNPSLTPHEEEDPIRAAIEGSDTPFSAEFTVTLNVLHFREETENRFRATYASFCHEPDDAAEMERVLGCQVHTGASWNGWALARDVWRLPLRRRDSVLSSLLHNRPTRQLRASHHWRITLSMCDESWLNASEATIRASRQLLGRLARQRDHSSDALLSQVCLIGNWSTSHKGRCGALSQRLLPLNRRNRVLARLFGSCGLQQGVQTMAP